MTQEYKSISGFLRRTHFSSSFFNRYMGLRFTSWKMYPTYTPIKPSRIITIPPMTSMLAIRDLQPGTSSDARPVNQNDNTYAIWMAARQSKIPPSVIPTYSGINEKEKIASIASRNIFPNEYFDLPP